MNIKEIRHGNWITSKSSKPVNWQICVSDFEMIYDNPEHYEPIPLTEEWLLKFGFTKATTFKGYYKDLKARMYLQFYQVPSQLDICQDGKSLSFASSQVKYVHQLQNLYFSLTGEELISE